VELETTLSKQNGVVFATDINYQQLQQLDLFSTSLFLFRQLRMRTSGARRSRNLHERWVLSVSSVTAAQAKNVSKPGCSGMDCLTSTCDAREIQPTGSCIPKCYPNHANDEVWCKLYNGGSGAASGDEQWTTVKWVLNHIKNTLMSPNW
jgi:hypothetical protein